MNARDEVTVILDGPGMMDLQRGLVAIPAIDEAEVRDRLTRIASATGKTFRRPEAPTRHPGPNRAQRRAAARRRTT